MVLNLTGLVLVILMLNIATAEKYPPCPVNSEYKECGTACPPTCQDKNPKICDDLCVKGCFCIKGYIKESQNGPCVPDDCQSTCGKHEIYTSCKTACPKICNETSPRICPQYCSTGCICEDGYVREKNTGQCISEKYCCGENETFQTCGSACPGTCSQPTQPCTKNCKIGCFCKKDFILDDNTRKCIRKTDCSNSTKAN